MYHDAEHFLDLSRKNKNFKKMEFFKQRKMYARISVLLYHSTVEALLNYLLYMHCFSKMSESIKKHLERLPYEVKLVEITKNIGKKGKGLENTSLFKKLKELQELRNSFVHPKLLKYSARVVKNLPSTKIPIIEMSVIGSKFSHSKLQKNFMHLDYADAMIAKSIVNSFLKWLKANMKNHIELTTILRSKGIRLKAENIKSLQIIVKGGGNDLFDILLNQAFLENFRKS